MLTIKEVEHIAKLARLELNEDEKEKFSKQLSSILDYVKKLEEVNTDNIEITAQVTGLLNVFEDDKIREISEERKEKIINNAPKHENNMFKVKRIMQ